MEIIEAAKIGAACLVAIAATGASLETANNYYGFKNRYHRAAADYETFGMAGMAEKTDRAAKELRRSDDGLRRARLHIMIFVPVAIVAWSALVMFL